MLTHKFKLSIFLTTILLCASCQNDGLDQEDLNQEEQSLSKEATATLDYLIEKGYSKEDLIPNFKDEAFIHDDYVIPFALKGNMDKNPSKKGSVQEKNQWNYVGNGVYYSNSRNVSYYVERNYPRDLEYVLSWAAYHWSRSSANINIRRTYTRSSADILVGSWYNSNEVAWARALLPDGRGNVGAWMRVNTAKSHPGDESTMALLIHELGHNLGYLHSDQNDGGQIPGTNGPSYHQRNNCGSVMKSSVYTCNWRFSSTPGWSRDDRTAITWAYGN
ncbi:hypothetical protein ATE84_3967 [Aquimarina sp. MAR_2010_214]|uniref:hypothetical protein n=1 Tax=Aquimarina sp. MAR_2010_214 TaxID=1250026 RepID=UPI000C71262C|nr:hypothetical protein [Aquimarina sp. MAR_2010_214]PKV51867.1 hypothetical protein ATE84_3967 [Aquimarina sp. MAR_2010_214]